jgi:hypothetical protein
VGGRVTGVLQVGQVMVTSLSSSPSFVPNTWKIKGRVGGGVLR